MTGLSINKKFRIDDAMQRDLAVEAKRTDRSEGAVIRVALREHLAKAPKAVSRRV